MNPFFLSEPKPRKRPNWLPPGLWEKTTGLFSVSLLGVAYKFPITPETAPFVRLCEGELDPWPSGFRRRKDFARRMLAEHGLQDMINCLLCQVRETEVDEAAKLLAQDIQHLLLPAIRGKIQSNMDLPRLVSRAGGL